MVYLVRDEQSRSLAQQALKSLRVDGGKLWRIEVSRFSRQRTLRQNKLLRLWERVISDDTGQPVEDVQVFIRQTFLGVDKRTVLGQEISVVRSTKNLTVAEFTALLDKVQLWAGEDLGIVLPQPDSIGWDDLIAKYGTE